MRSNSIWRAARRSDGERAGQADSSRLKYTREENGIDKIAPQLRLLSESGGPRPTNWSWSSNGQHKKEAEPPAPPGQSSFVQGSDFRKREVGADAAQRDGSVRLDAAASARAPPIKAPEGPATAVGAGSKLPPQLLSAVFVQDEGQCSRGADPEGNNPGSKPPHLRATTAPPTPLADLGLVAIAGDLLAKAEDSEEGNGLRGTQKEGKATLVDSLAGADVGKEARDGRERCFALDAREERSRDASKEQLEDGSKADIGTRCGLRGEDSTRGLRGGGNERFDGLKEDVTSIQDGDGGHAVCRHDGTDKTRGDKLKFELMAGGDREWDVKLRHAADIPAMVNTVKGLGMQEGGSKGTQEQADDCRKMASMDKGRWCGDDRQEWQEGDYCSLVDTGENDGGGGGVYGAGAVGMWKESDEWRDLAAAGDQESAEARAQHSPESCLGMSLSEAGIRVVTEAEAARDVHKGRAMRVGAGPDASGQGALQMTITTSSLDEAVVHAGGGCRQGRASQVDGLGHGHEHGSAMSGREGEASEDGDSTLARAAAQSDVEVVDEDEDFLAQLDLLEATARGQGTAVVQACLGGGGGLRGSWQPTEEERHGKEEVAAPGSQGAPVGGSGAERGLGDGGENSMEVRCRNGAAPGMRMGGEGSQLKASSSIHAKIGGKSGPEGAQAGANSLTGAGDAKKAALWWDGWRRIWR